MLRSRNAIFSTGPDSGTTSTDCLSGASKECIAIVPFFDAPMPLMIIFAFTSCPFASFIVNSSCAIVLLAYVEFAPVLLIIGSFSVSSTDAPVAFGAVKSAV